MEGSGRTPGRDHPRAVNAAEWDSRIPGGPSRRPGAAPGLVRLPAAGLVTIMIEFGSGASTCWSSARRERGVGQTAVTTAADATNKRHTPTARYIDHNSDACYVDIGSLIRRGHVEQHQVLVEGSPEGRIRTYSVQPVVAVRRERTRRVHIAQGVAGAHLR